ncbi:MAG TPA: hypothetical protein VD905_16250 [Flavobacteriales bacterium]|nr:hypothetical protein [Flavobacteriales bacterium]
MKINIVIFHFVPAHKNQLNHTLYTSYVKAYSKMEITYPVISQVWNGHSTLFSG